ncbi:MAG: signal peptidase I, partial [Nanoarchaeota archaeon]
MRKKIVFLLICAFLIGWLSHSFQEDITSAFPDHNLYSDKVTGNFAGAHYVAEEKAMPADRVSQEAIHIMSEKVILDVENPKWSKFTDTKSMEPVLGKGAYGIHVIPEKPSEINVGDIIAYRSDYTNGTIIHRVIDIGEDEEGVFYILKGDNNPSQDPGKVRFEQVERILVAIVY